jgi:uncharacterized SAM-binding protein YcdF (DUF218 family)
MRNLIGYGFLAPPNILIVLCTVGALLSLVWRRVGILVVLVSSFSLYILATPAFSSYLLWYIESKIPEGNNLNIAQVIVVLGVDIRRGRSITPERLGPQSLERLVMAAEAYRRLHLPIAVSGGLISDSQMSVAELMKIAFEQQFAIPVTWSEERSRNTYENAAYTAKLLREANIGTVVVIAQARDLPRIIWSFEHSGLRALPWPAPRTSSKIDRIGDFLPNTEALAESYYTLHEIIGGLYYPARY